METTEILPPQLTIQDLKGIQLILDMACKRGTFGAQEVSIVGNLYTKLQKFIAASETPKAVVEEDKPE